MFRGMETKYMAMETKQINHTEKIASLTPDRNGNLIWLHIFLNIGCVKVNIQNDYVNGH